MTVTLNNMESIATMAGRHLTEITVPKSRLKRLIPLDSYTKPLAKLTRAQQAIIDRYKEKLSAAIKEIEQLEYDLTNPNITKSMAKEIREAIAEQEQIVRKAQYSIRGAKKAFYGEQLLNTIA